MNKIYIRLLEDFAGHKAGSVLHEDEGIARAYIAHGKAVESNGDEHLTAMLRSEREETQRLFDARIQAMETRFASIPSAGPPSRGMAFGDDGVPIPPGTTVEAGESSVDRGPIGFGDLLRSIAVESSPIYEHSERERCGTRIRAHYAEGVNAYDRSGKPVQRAGSESLTGGSTYGYLIKPEFYGSLFEFAAEDSVLYPYGLNVPIGTTNELNIPTLDQYLTNASGQSSQYAGLWVGRKGEADARPRSDAKLRNVTFKTTDLTGFTVLSRDLVADNYIAADMIIQRLFARAMAWKMDYECFNGDDVGKPLGYFNSPALLTVTKVTSSHIRLEDLFAMQAALHPASWKNAVWYAHQSCLADLGAIISASPNVLAYQPNTALSQAMELSIMGKTAVNDMKYRAAGTLQGRPIYFTEKVPKLTVTGCLSLVDPTQYGIATRAGLEVGLSEHFLFDTDQLAFRFKIRNDMRPMWLSYYTDPSAVKYSPFIQLTQ